jgi:sulfonate transport system permease protein
MATRQPSKSPGLRATLRSAVLPLLILSTWAVFSRNRAASYAFVPLPDLGASLLEVVANGELPRSLVASLAKAMTALTIGTVLGVAFGSTLGAVRLVDRAVGPFFHAFRQVPHLGLAPLMGLWFGTGDFPKLVLVFLAVFYPIVLSTYQGVRAIDDKHMEVARALMLSRTVVFWKVLLPAVLPYVYSGLSQAIAFAWIATIGSEMLLSTGHGVGTMMQHAGAGARMDIVLVCVLSIGAVSMTIDYAVRRAGRFLMRWRDTRESMA